MTLKKTGVLLVNLGTPARADKKAVRAFLKEFLSDARVVDLPVWMRQLLLHSVILPFRTGKTTHAYKAIWDQEKGSPLLFHSQDLLYGLQAELGEQYHVALGMRYGEPSVWAAIEKLLEARCSSVIIVPLFPQYSSAASGSAIAKVMQGLLPKQHIPHLTIVSDFFREPDYINAQVALMAPHLQDKKPDCVLFSYHSLPWRQIQKGASTCQATCLQNQPCNTISAENQLCYRAQCYETSRLIAQELGIDSYHVVFQSRLGRIPWVGPDLSTVMSQLIQGGKRNLLVASPSFVADCLETLEEIGIRAKGLWQDLGGKEFTLVSCLNSHPLWIKGLANIVKANIKREPIVDSGVAAQEISPA